jgi:hypothetical protein
VFFGNNILVNSVKYLAKISLIMFRNYVKKSLYFLIGSQDEENLKQFTGQSVPKYFLFTRA